MVSTVCVYAMHAPLLYKTLSLSSAYICLVVPLCIKYVIILIHFSVFGFIFNK